MHVVFVDDDDTICSILELAFEHEPNMTAHVFGSAEAALEFIDEGTVLPGIVVLDLNMPGIDGRETLALMKQREILRFTRFAYLSASGEAEKEALLATGAHAVINKPFDPKSIAGTVRSILSC